MHRAPERPAASERSRQRVAAAGLVVLGTLLVTWPFVRVPRFGIVPAFLHLAAAWACLVGALLLLSRALARGDGEEDPGG